MIEVIVAGSLLVFGVVFIIMTRKTGDDVKERGSKGARWTLES
jgi:hypothetical protein